MDRSRTAPELPLERIPNVSKSGLLGRFEAGLLKKSQQYKVVLSSSMLFFYLPSQLDRPKYVHILRPDTKVIRGAVGDAGPQIKIDDMSLIAANLNEADDWASMVEIAVRDPGNTAGRSLAYIGLAHPLSFARLYRLQLTQEEEDVLREKESQLAPPPPAATGIKSPERMRVPEDRVVSARPLSPLRQTSMVIPGTLVHSGWLYRRGMMNNWKKKWFLIIGSSIYFSDTKDSEMMQQLPLARDTVVREERDIACPDCDPEGSFKITSKRTGVMLYLSAETSLEKTAWASEIKQAIRHIDIVYHTIVLSMLTALAPPLTPAPASPPAAGSTSPPVVNRHSLASGTVSTWIERPSPATNEKLPRPFTEYGLPPTSMPLPLPLLPKADTTPASPPLSPKGPLLASGNLTAAAATISPARAAISPMKGRGSPTKHPSTTMFISPGTTIAIPVGNNSITNGGSWTFEEAIRATSSTTSPTSPAASPPSVPVVITCVTAPTSQEMLRSASAQPSVALAPLSSPQEMPRSFSAAQPNKQVASSPGDAGTALYNLYRPLGKATARFDPIKIGARNDPPLKASTDDAPRLVARKGGMPRAPLRALERIYEVIDSAKLGANVESSPSIHEGWLTQVKPAGQKLVYGVLKPGFFRYYRAVQKAKFVLDAGTAVTVSRFDSSPVAVHEAALKVTVTTANGEATFAVEDAVECNAWVRAIEKRTHHTAWVTCLRATGWKSGLASVLGNNFGLFTASLKGTLSLAQCTLVNSDEPLFSWTLLSDVSSIKMKAAVAVDFAKWCSVLSQEIEAVIQNEPTSPATGSLTVLGRRRLDAVKDLVAPFHASLAKAEERRFNVRAKLLQRQKRRPFVILAIEATGPLDVVPAVVLDKLCTQIPNFLSSVDLVTGTSSASFIASCIALGIPASVVRSLAELKTQLCHPGLGSRDSGLESALYDHGPLNAFLTEVFGHLTIADADRFLLLSALEYNLGGLTPILDHNLDAPSTRTIAEMLLPAMSTPVLFPTSRRCFDLGAASPSMVLPAILLASSRFRILPSDITVISLGSFVKLRELPAEESLNWGSQQWLPYLAQTSRDGSSRLTQVLSAEACGERFIHYAPAQSEGLQLDDCSAEIVQRLASEADIAPLVAFVRQRLAEP